MPALPYVPIQIKGLLEPGNIDLSHRPVVKNQDGSVSTVKSMSIGVDGREVLIPMVAEGKMLTAEQAIKRFQTTGEHLGVFDSPATATAYAEALHRQQARDIESHVWGQP